ncbi:Fc.00g003290.m01.CDS01 [Cosmosporella sp. VM-42]
MLYDLNIAWSPSTTPEQLLATLSLASTLGYTTVALNHTLTLPFPAVPVAPFPPLPTATSSTTRLPTVLHRATLPLADPAASNYRLPSLAAAYDILAIRPLTEKGFQNACLTIDVPIISLDLTQQFPFYFRPKPCMAAVTRGVRFEICYSQSLGADARGRANFISNATSLIRATRGRGIIISSEARNALSLRAPADIVNLLSVWGLNNEKGIEGFRAMPRAVVVNEGMKRSGFRGVIDIVEVAKRDEQPGDVDQEKAKGAVGKKNKQQQNQKRKGGDEESPAVSKRQAKKMKLAARGAAAEKK